MRPQQTTLKPEQGLQVRGCTTFSLEEGFIWLFPLPHGVDTHSLGLVPLPCLNLVTRFISSPLRARLRLVINGALFAPLEIAYSQPRFLRHLTPSFAVTSPSFPPLLIFPY